MPSNAIMDKAKGVIREKGKKVFMDKFIDRHRAANRSANRQMQIAMQRQVAVNQNDPTTVSSPFFTTPLLPSHPILTDLLQDPDRIIPAARRAETAVDLELFGPAAVINDPDNHRTDTDTYSAENRRLRLREAALVPGSSAAAPPVRARNPTALVSAADLEMLLGENKEALDAANKPQKGGRKGAGAGNKNKKEKMERAGKKEEEDSDLPSFASSAYPGAPTDGSIIPRGLMHVNRGFWPKAVRERVEKAEAAEAEAARSTRAEMRRAGAVERRKERERKREMLAEKLRKRELREKKIREERERRMREKKEREEREKKAKEAPSSGAKKRKADAVENESDEDEDPIVVPMRKFRRLAKPRKE